MRLINAKHGTFPFCLQPLFLLCVISLCTAAWDISSQQDANKQCAQIFFKPSFQGPYILLKDDEQISDLTDIRNHYTKDVSSHNETIQQEQGGNDDQKETASSQDAVSFRVQGGCTLKLSATKFLKDDVHSFTEQLEAMQFAPNSASCTCPKMCNCDEIQLRRSECARAYLNDDCSNCKALFTTMRPGDGWKTFPEMWSPFVKSIVIRPGCDVSMRLEHTGDTVHTLSSSTARIIGNVQQAGNITEYHCECSEFIPPSPRGGSTDQSNKNYPPLINIPRTKGAINTMLFKDELKTHPGLMAALQSLRSKRTSKNAYILLLGMTGSGKSSAVNLLFDHPNITKTGDFVSTTSDILEFTIPVPVPELGMNNTALHVIDTPGIGDTRGLADDARFLASLEDFLNKHEDLKRNLPNVVLIFTKFSDNRFRGDGASFVKMLRTLDLFKDKIIDKKSTNVIFVLTHYMSETKEITRDPSKRIQSIRQVIQEFSTLPRPIHIVLAENKPDDLPSINGFYQLPNGEFYPKNLFDQMQRSLNGDPVGESVIRAAFSNSDNFRITGKVHRLLHKSNAKVTRYLGMLASFNTPVTGTEVSSELESSYALLDPTSKSRYPDALNTLQRALYLRNILTIADLPRSVTETLRLFENIHINPATLFLLQNAFNITIPEFKTDFVVGSGYSLISDSTLPSKIFQTHFTTNQPSDLLFRVPDTYHVEVLNRLDNQIQVFTTKQDFIKARMKSLGLSSDTIPQEAYRSSFSGHPGFNLISLSENASDISWDSLTATVDYHTFQIGLSSNAKFTNEFTTILGQLETLNLTDSESVSRWSNFFSRYGTHVVSHAFGGGSIIVKTTLVNENDESASSSSLTNSEKIAKLSETMANIMQELANELIGKDAIYEPPEGIQYEFFQRGGDHTYYWSNFSELDDTKNIDKWKDSLKYEPVVLARRLQLVPISEAVKALTNSPDLGIMIEEAAVALFNASLVYIPVQRMGEDKLESRDRLGSDMSHQPGDFESMQEFANMFKMITESSKEMQANMIRLMAEAQEKQQQKEAQFQQEMLLLRQQEAEKERARMEQDRYDREMQLKRDEMEIQRITQENALRAQMEQSRQQADLQQRRMMAELQAKNEQTMLSFINAENDRRTQITLNKKSWLDKTLDFIGQGFQTAASGAASALPFLAMSGMG